MSETSDKPAEIAQKAFEDSAIKLPEPTPAPQEPEVALSNLLREYKENSDARNTAIDSTLTQIEALSSYMGGLAAPYDQILGDLQGKIQAIMFERKEKFICESGKITYFRAGVKRSWNLDALDSICKFDLRLASH
ncbi:MAG: hypothetical protein Q8M94_18140 [Ignavibacteria bacterium]|nr:hypothetical protein [Ignavibacteria bacterium]